MAATSLWPRSVDWDGPAPRGGVGVMAEREGFEPPEPFGSPDFESGALDHSATSPPEGNERRNSPPKRKQKTLLIVLVLKGHRIGAVRREVPGEKQVILHEPPAPGSSV